MFRFRFRRSWLRLFLFYHNLHLDNVIVMIHICYNCFLMGSLVFQSDLLSKLCVPVGFCPNRTEHKLATNNFQTRNNMWLSVTMRKWVLQKPNLFLNSCQNRHFLRFYLTSSDQKSVTNFLKTQKDAINREISTIAFIFGATFHQTPRGCKVELAK